MPTIKIEQDVLKRILESQGLRHELERLGEELPLLGTDIDRCDEEMLEIEIFPDRPDLLSCETLVRAIGPFLQDSEASPELDVEQGEIHLDVDESLAEIRPVILGAVVRGVNNGSNQSEKESFIKSLMDHQEKLHFALGRGRTKASIGVHDLANLSPPFTVKSVSGEHKFIPLQMDEEMSIQEILRKHPKGIEYAHLLEGNTRFPVILDSENKVLSFPPIINGDNTTVNHSTTDFFIDVTGWDQRACECCLLLICLQLACHGGTVESISINSCDNQELISPNGNPMKHTLASNLVSDILGHDFKDEELEKALSRMGGRYLGRENGNLQIQMPRWRYDMLHPIDLVEEIAIGHGYENLGTASPAFPTSATPRHEANFNRRLRESLQGMGLQQVQSLTLSNDHDQFEAMRWRPQGEVTRIKNPISIDHTLMRQSVMGSLLRLLAANRRHELPQRVYETGICVRNHNNCNRVAWLCAENTSSFSASRGMVQALLRDLGVDSSQLEVEWKSVPEGTGPWLSGRSGSIVISGEEVGQMGEIDPNVAELFELKVPLHGAEFDCDVLQRLIPDPVH